MFLSTFNFQSWSVPARELERGDGDKQKLVVPSPELSYTVQGDLIRSSIPEVIWNEMAIDTRRYLLNLSHHMDDYFMFQTFPYGWQSPIWTIGEKSMYIARFRDWIANGVDPSMHWGLFSLDFPRKTGNMCRFLFKRGDIQSNIGAIKSVTRENTNCLKEFQIRKFREICTMLLNKSQIAATNKTARETALAEIVDQEAGERCHLTHETCFSDKVSYCKYPGTGFVTGGVKCYASVILQFLTRLDELVDLVSLQLIAEENKFLKTFIDLRYQLETIGPPIEIDSLLKMLHLDNERQQDAHELLVLILGSLHTAFRGQHQEKFEALFVTAIQKTGPDCVTRDTIVNIDVHLTDSSGEELCLLRLLNESLASCDFVSGGEMFIVHVVRTIVSISSNESGQITVKKALCKIGCPNLLDMTRFGGQVYSLIGIIYHEGSTVESGHYFGLFFEMDTIILVDGPHCQFVSRDDTRLRERLARAQEHLFRYGCQVHVRCSFVVSQLVNPQPKPECVSSVDEYDEKSKLHTQELSSISPLGKSESPSPKRYSTARTTSNAHLRFQKTIASLVAERRNNGTHRHMSLEEKLFIATFSGRGISSARLASAMGRHGSTVGRFLCSPLGQEAPTRATLLNNGEILKIVLNESLKDQRMSSSRLAAKIFLEHHTLISKETVRKIRRKVGMRFLAPIPKARLTDLNKDVRVAFACDWIYNRLHLLRRTPIQSGRF